MKTKFALLLVFCAISLNIFAQEKKIKDRRTNPELYYLEESEVANSLELLPPPPEAGSILFLYDKARYDWGKLQRDTPRGEQAVSDARVNGDGVPFAFSEAFGIEITRDKTPELYRLIINMREDAGDLATRHAKEYYMRVRPFSFFNEMTCNPEQQEELSTNGSYPSGHTAIGWATALVLAEVNPDRQNEILKRGFEMGQSRVICGYHFQSDVDAARIVASAVVARLHANDAFVKQLNKAKDEFSKLLSPQLQQFDLVFQRRNHTIQYRLCVCPRISSSHRNGWRGNIRILGNRQGQQA
jgi:acid phosphatase (class A)